MTDALKLVSIQPEVIPGVVASAAYADGRRVAEVPIEEVGEWSRKPGHLVWIGLHEPDLNLLRQLQAEFGLHDLAIEDALKAHQRPKLEQFGEALFVVARTAQMLDGRIAFGETHLFVGHGYVVSVRHGASTSYTPCASAARPLRRPALRGRLHPLCDPRLHRRQLHAGDRDHPGRGGGDRGLHP